MDNFHGHMYSIPKATRLALCPLQKKLDKVSLRKYYEKRHFVNEIHELKTELSSLYLQLNPSRPVHS